MFCDKHPHIVFKFCPKCGSQKFEPIGERAKKCDDCSFIYYFNTSAAVAALIFDKNQKLLFTRRAIQPFLGMLDLPGGFVDHMETAEEALCRELKEELGVTVKKLNYLCSFPNKYPFSGLSVFTLDLAFIVQLESIENMIAKDDISGFEFIDPANVNTEELPSYSMKKIIEKLNNR